MEAKKSFDNMKDEWDEQKGEAASGRKSLRPESELVAKIKPKISV